MDAPVTRSPRFPGLPLALLFLTAALGALVLFGILGVGRGGSVFAHDMRYLYGAGAVWLQGASPYDLETFKAAMLALLGVASDSFAYPPNAFPLAAILGSGSPARADLLIGLLNLMALAGLALFVRAAVAAAGDGRDRLLVLVTIAVLVGNPFTAHVFWMGQTTLIAAALVYGAWLCAHRRMDVLAGVLLGLSAFKPQIAFLVGLWFLLDRRWLLLAAAAGATLAASAWPIATGGLAGSWLAWAATLHEYQSTGFNTVTFRHVFGLRSLLAGLGLPAPSLLPAGVAALIGLYLMRRRYDEIWLVNAVLVISFLMLFAHDYDLAPVAVIAAPLLTVARGRPGVLVLLCLLAAVIFFPQRVWQALDLAPAARSRELALLALLGLYLRLCRKPATARAPRAAAPI
ncbi:glycosyltransferase family 87 protein [Paracoccus tibetensis]|uniref:DUF2029 domain-containing protein n=1 Tax=Paracoccus tibetensis TaxID=336292 RepID=A0A1G5FN12_9RHOB|nr:glycosyltransferase family 87 protein [Paracoccus tibetensis]SCY40742.1 Protein of unknown function [Paracoccus tibetensis]